MYTNIFQKYHLSLVRCSFDTCMVVRDVAPEIADPRLLGTELALFVVVESVESVVN